MLLRSLRVLPVAAALQVVAVPPPVEAVGGEVAPVVAGRVVVGECLIKKVNSVVYPLQYLLLLPGPLC